MYIHFGEDTVVKAKDIIAIIDKKSFQSSGFINELIKKYPTHSIQQQIDSIKSIIVTSDHIYFTPLATNTLKKRSQKWFVSDF